MKSDKFTVFTLMCLLLMGSATQATLLVYDGFVSGGASPNAAAGEYETGTGYSDDDLIGQNPTISGTTGAWQNDGSGYDSTLYYGTQASQMDYVDGNGHSLVTTTGQLSLQRTAGSSTDDNNVYRDLAIGNSLPTNMYISMLVRMTPGESFTFRSASTDGGASRRFNFGIDNTGTTFVTNTLNSNIYLETGTATAAADVTHLLVVRLRDTGFTNDETTLYLDPILSSEGVNTPDAEVADGNSYVGGNGSWTLKDMYLRAVAGDAGSSVIIDEIRFGTTWEDVTPHVIPEPSSFILLTLALGLFGIFARKK